MKLVLYWLTVLAMAGRSILMVDAQYNPTCTPRHYTHRVTQRDSQGRACVDDIQVMSCRGRCDSNEISDWRFPYKRSYHPVCLHDSTMKTTITLRNCDPDADPGTERYEVLQAVTCRCSVCKSSEASCEGLRYRGLHGG